LEQAESLISAIELPQYHARLLRLGDREVNRALLQTSVLSRNFFTQQEQLTDADVPYEVGVTHYREIARGQISGHTDGRLKILFHRETLELLGVHIFGENADELLHFGQAVFKLKGKINYFINTVFNYPTLAECYKTAAFKGLNRLG
jgi:hypothetical protein